MWDKRWVQQPAFQRANYGANSYPVALPASSVTSRFAQMQSDPICSSAGCAQYKQPAGPPQHPMDYFVPNFGMDKDILATEANEKVASALVGHAWSFKTPESFEKYRNRAKDVDYNFDPALDGNMVDSLNSLRIAGDIRGQGIKSLD